MKIKFPKESDVTAKHRAFVVSLGGALGVSTGDKIIGLAETICSDWNRANTDKLALFATGAGSVFYSSRSITERICEICAWMLERSGTMPKLVLIGKSMGGCKLHHVARRLDEECAEIDLFIGVDISCHVARHYDNYVNDGWDELRFPRNVKWLVNFFQHKEHDPQCGHVAIWDGHGQCQHPGKRAMCRDYNINVNDEKVQVDDKGDLVFGGSKNICETEVGHLEIDSEQNLLHSIQRIVTQKVLKTL